jgi:hypothetical protein
MLLVLLEIMATTYCSTIFLTYVHQQKIFPSERNGYVRDDRDTPVADYFTPGLNTTGRIAYRTPIAVSLFLLALSVSYFEHTLWR